MRQLLPLLTLAVLLTITACNPASKQISYESFEEDVRAIIAKDPEMPEDKVEILEHYIALFKDRESYVDHMTKQDEDFDDETVISNKQFIKKTDKFFTRLAKKEYTYQDMLDEIDKRVEVNEQFDEDLKPLQLEIDSLCEIFQSKIDSVQSRQDAMKDSLDRMLSFEIIQIKSDYEYYSSSVDVKIKMINHTGKPIEAVSFHIDVKDKLGEPITEMKLQTMEQFTTEKTETFTFSRYGDNSDAFRELQDVELNQIAYTSTVRKINVGGEIFEQGGSGAPMTYKENFRYSGYNVHFEGKGDGDCPYLIRGSEYEEEIAELTAEKEEELKAAGGKILKAFERHEKTLTKEKKEDPKDWEMEEF